MYSDYEYMFFSVKNNKTKKIITHFTKIERQWPIMYWVVGTGPLGVLQENVVVCLIARPDICSCTC